MTTPGQEQSQDWFFTFGADHIHPDTGQRLGKSYVRIYGTCDSTRDVMFAAFGNRWSHQYKTAERAGADKYGLTEVPMPAGTEGRLLAAACRCQPNFSDAACPEHGLLAFLQAELGAERTGES